MSTEGGRASRTTAQLYAQVLETGCLCGPAPGEAEEVLLGSLLEGAREALKTTPGVQGDEEEELLMLLSLIRAVMETTLRAQGEKGKKGAPYGMCRTMMTFAKASTTKQNKCSDRIIINAISPCLIGFASEQMVPPVSASLSDASSLLFRSSRLLGQRTFRLLGQKGALQIGGSLQQV